MKKDLSLYKKYLKMQKTQKFAGGGQAQPPQQIGQNPFAFLNQQDGTQGLNLQMQALPSNNPSASLSSGANSSSVNPLAGMQSLLPSASSSPDVGGSAAGGATYAGADVAPAQANPFESTLSSMSGTAPQMAAYNGGKVPHYYEGGISGSTHTAQYAGGGKVLTDAQKQAQIAILNAIAAHDNLSPIATVGSGMGDVKMSDNVDQNYYDGGSAYPESSPTPTAGKQTQDERDAESEEITKREDDKKFQDDAEKKELQDKTYSKGGKVKKPEHNLNNLKDLKAAFDKFIAEEGGEKLSSGGKVGSGERFAKLENKLSHQKGVTDPGALAASIGREKYGNAKMNKMAHAHMNQGGHVLDANARKHIASKNFAAPDRSYPINDANHARNALSRVSQFGSPELKAQVRAKVHSKYPSIGMDEGGEVPKAIIKVEGLNPQPSPSPSPNPDQDAINHRAIGNFFPDQPGYAEGGQVNLAAPNNGKLPYYLPHDQIQLYKRYLALNQPKEQHFDGSNGSVVQPDPTDPNNYNDDGSLKSAPPSANSVRHSQLKEMFPQWSDDKINTYLQSQKPSRQLASIPNPQPSAIPTPSPDIAPSTSPQPQVNPTLNPQSDPNAAQAVQNSFNNATMNGLGHYKGGKIQHFDEGGESVPQDPVYPDLTPEQEAANAAELAQLKANGVGQEQVQGDEQDITGVNPSKIADIEMSENPDDKSLEEELANEDFSADEVTNDNNPDKKRELADDESDDDSEDDDNQQPPIAGKLPGDVLKAEETAKDSDSAAGLQVNSDIQKMIDATQSGKDDLAQAQKQRDLNAFGQQMAKYGALAGAGLAGRNGAKSDPTEALKVIESNDQYTNLPVQKYQEQIANQQNDPNSAMSQVVRAYYKNKGINVPDTASASDIKQVAPYYMKDQTLQNAINKVVLQQVGAGARNANSVTAANQRAQDKNALIAKEGDLNRKNQLDAKQFGQEAKQAGVEQKAEQAMTNARSKPALAMAQRNLVYLANMNKMFEDYGDPDKWTPSQVAAWNTEKAKVAQGGVPTESMTNELSNPTYGNQMAGLIQKFTSTPTGAGQGKFIAQDKKYIDGLHDVSQGVIKGNAGDVLKSYQNGLTPDAYKNMVYRHSDILGLYNPNQENGINAVMAAKGLSRQDAIKALIAQGKIKDVNY